MGYLLEREGRRAALTPVFGVLALVGALTGVAAIVASMASPLWREIRAQEAELDT
jgi:hypothetical protein